MDDTQFKLWHPRNTRSAVLSQTNRVQDKYVGGVSLEDFNHYHVVGRSPQARIMRCNVFCADRGHRRPNSAVQTSDIQKTIRYSDIETWTISLLFQRIRIRFIWNDKKKKRNKIVEKTNDNIFVEVKYSRSILCLNKQFMGVLKNDFEISSFYC